MTSGEDTRQYSAEELQARRTERASKTDLAAIRAKTEVELERDIAGDPDFRDIPTCWHLTAEAVMPTSKVYIVKPEEDIEIYICTSRRITIEWTP